MPRVTLTVGAEGAAAASDRGDVVVIVDALRASTTIVAALAAGIRSVRPVATPEECVGEVTAGERDGVKLPGCDLDNSPTSVANTAFTGKDLVLTTTNGTRCILAGAENRDATVLVGALVNATAVGHAAARIARDRNGGVSIVIAGNAHRPSPEDHIAATAIADAMDDVALDGAEHALRVVDAEEAFLQSEAGVSLTAMGRRGDVIACAQVDEFSVVPILRNGSLVPHTA